MPPDTLLDAQVVYDDPIPDTQSEDIMSQEAVYDEPVQEVVYDDERGKAYDAPAGLSGKEITHAVATQLEGRDKKDFFGLIDMGNDYLDNFFKGAGSDIASLPSVFGSALIERGMTGGPELAAVTAAIKGFLSEEQRETFERVDKALGFGIDDFMVDLGERIIEANQRFISDFELEPTGEHAGSQFMFDLGSGASNVATSMGLLVLTKSPRLIALLFGAKQKGAIFLEGLESGKSAETASMLSTLAGGIEGAIEGIGGGVILKAISVNKPLLKAAFIALEQGFEEGLQQIGEEAVTQFSGIRDDDWDEIRGRILYSSLLGAILGGKAGAITSFLQRSQVKKMITDKGVPEEEAQTILNHASQKTLESGEVQAEIRQMLMDEIGVFSATISERKSGMKEIMAAFDEARDEAALPETAVSAELVNKIKDTETRGRATQLLSEQQTLADEITQIEKLRDESVEDSQRRDLSSLAQKKVDQLNEMAEDIDGQLEDTLDDQSSKPIQDKIKKLKNQKRSVAKRITEATKTLAEAKNIDESNSKKADSGNIKKDAFFDKSVKALREEFDAKGDELVQLVAQRGLDIDLSDDIKLKVKSLENLQDTMRRELKQTAKTTERLARLAEKRKITEMQKLMKRIKKADIKDLTFEARVEIQRLQKLVKEAKTLNELRALNKEVQRVKNIGKEQLSIIKEMRDTLHKAKLQALHEALKKTPIKKKATRSATGETVSEFETLKRRARAVGLRPPRFLDKLDGGQDFEGAFNQILYDSINRSYNKEVALTNEGTAVGVQTMKDTEITSEDLGGTIEVDGIVFSIDEATDIYASMKNPNDAAVLVYGNNRDWQHKDPLKLIDSVIRKLPQKYKTAVDVLMKEMGSHYGRVRVATLIESDGTRDLVKAEGYEEGEYRPRHRTEVPYNNFNDEQLDEIKSRSAYSRAFPNKNITFQRAKIPKQYQTPMRLGFFSNYFSHVAAREHFIAMSRTIKDLQRLINDKDLKLSIKERFGDEMNQEVQKFVNRAAVPSIYKTHSGLEKTVASMRQSAAIVHLGFNLVTMAKQIPSFALALGEVGFEDMGAAISEVTQDFKTTWEFVKSRDPQMSNRQIERELEERKKALQGKGGPLSKITSRSFDGIKLFDRIAVTIVWKAKYNEVFRKTADEGLAIEQAQKAVLRTQPAAAAKDIASIYAESEFLNVMTQFTNQLNQNYQIITYDIPMRKRLGTKEGDEAAMRGAIGIVFNALMIFIAGHGRIPTEPEDLTEAGMAALIGTVPVVGPLINSVRKGFDGLPATLDLFVKKPIEFVYAIADEDPEKVFKNGAYFAAGAFKVPFTQIYRSITGIGELAEGETDDLRRLVYSGYVLEN